MPATVTRHANQVVAAPASAPFFEPRRRAASQPSATAKVRFSFKEERLIRPPRRADRPKNRVGNPEPASGFGLMQANG